MGTTDRQNASAPPPAGAGSVWSRRALRLGVWARRVHLFRRMAYVTVVCAVLSAVATFFVLSRPELMNSRVFWLLLNLDLLNILILGGLVTRAILRNVLGRGSRRASSRLHLRLTLLFSLVAVVPSIVLAVFLALTFFFGFESWFDQKVSTAIEESQEVAEAYLKTHKSAIAGEAAMLANDLNRVFYRLPDELTRTEYLRNQQIRRGLSQIVLFRAHEGFGGMTRAEVLARVGWGFSRGDTDRIPPDVMARVLDGEIGVLAGQANDQVRALVELAINGVFLYVARPVDPTVSDHIRKSGIAAQEYLAFKAHSGQLQLFYFLSYAIVSLLLLVAAVWVGLTIASRLVNPVIQLIDAAERVGEGNLAVRVPEVSASDEVALLGRAFNRMTARIDSQHRRLSEANRELDERRRFTETVLSGVSAGVIGVDALGCIHLPNPSAGKLLDVDMAAWIGHPIGQLLPDFEALLKEALGRPTGIVEREVEITTRAGRRVNLMTRVSAESGRDGAITGYVFTFDDMTELQAAQRTAAWADVARRIAHEIKNPLTPIQLSAERLKRKYLSQITDSPEVFERCTNIIIRHVSDIGQMVDEFSAFARMPVPRMEKTDLVEIVAQAVFLQQTAYGAITFRTTLPDEPVILSLDAAQMTQALTNMLKNSIESIEGRNRPAADEPPLEPGRIEVSLARESRGVVLRIRDNGRGLPEDMDVSRLTEPYVTTRAKGTGLGLAIVRKILEDHGGSLDMGNAGPDGPSRGVLVTVVLSRTS